MPAALPAGHPRMTNEHRQVPGPSTTVPPPVNRRTCGVKRARTCSIHNHTIYLYMCCTLFVNVRVKGEEVKVVL